MIYKQTRFSVIDNSGALEVQLIGSLKKQHYYCSIGNIINVAIKRAIKQKKVSRGEVRLALIVQTKKIISRYAQGYQLKFDTNEVILINKDNAPLGTRIKGILTQELKKNNQSKLLSMSSYII